MKRAVSRVKQLSFMSQLRAAMLDDNGLLNKNLLLCFVTPNEVDQIATDDMIFPYPFAQIFDHDIWWEDMLQAVKIKFHSSNDITRFLNVGDGDGIRTSHAPLFLFGHRGQPLVADTFARIHTSNYNDYVNWVWTQLEVQVTFVNHHPYPVEAFLMNTSKAVPYFTLQPGESNLQTSRLSHEWWFGDARVNTYPKASNDTDNHSGNSRATFSMDAETMVAIFKITNDRSPQTFHIEAKKCLDLSGQCKEED